MDFSGTLGYLSNHSNRLLDHIRHGTGENARSCARESTHGFTQTMQTRILDLLVQCVAVGLTSRYDCTKVYAVLDREKTRLACAQHVPCRCRAQALFLALGAFPLRCHLV